MLEGSGDHVVEGMGKVGKGGEDHVNVGVGGTGDVNVVPGGDDHVYVGDIVGIGGTQVKVGVVGGEIVPVVVVVVVVVLGRDPELEVGGSGSGPVYVGDVGGGRGQV